MADLSQVEAAMVQIAAQSLRLGANYIPFSVLTSPIAGAPCRVYRGWPATPDLSADLASGITNITVFPVAQATRRTTRYMPQWRSGPEVVPTLTGTVTGNAVIFSGAANPGQVAGVRTGYGLDGTAYAYRLQPGDTPTAVASQLAAIIPGASAAGPVLTIQSAAALDVRIAADQPAWLETRRQQQQMWVIGWAPDPMTRDAVMSVVDAGFANMTMDCKLSDFFRLADGSAARLQYVNNTTDDKAMQAGNWRRDLRYIVEYPTTLLESQPRVLFAGGNLQSFDDAETFAEYGDLAAT